MFSIITTALSTSIPSAMMSENRMMKFSVWPMTEKTKKLRNIESGIASPTSVALRTPRKNRSTATTKRMPAIMLFSRSLTRISTCSDWSPVSTYSVPFGRSKPSITSSAPFTTSMMFSPVDFLTFRRMT